MSRAERLRKIMQERLAPLHLEIADDSQRHAGHSGWRPEGETHFRIDIVSRAFEGQSRVARQQLVYRLLKSELDTGLHALQLRTRTPEEAGLD